MKNNKEKKADIKENKPIERKPGFSAWSPFEVFENMDRLFHEDPWTPPWWKRTSMRYPWSEISPLGDSKMALLDILDKGDKFKVIAELPGISKKDIDVNITPNGIKICGETKIESKQENEGYLKHERSYSTICRNMRFPEEVDPEKAEATLKDGILEIEVNKKFPNNKGKKIKIK